VLRGEAGVGKSALLTYVSDRARGSLLGAAVGVESEMELAYSSLHQLCAPILDYLDRLPRPQRAALETVFGLSEGPVPGRSPPLGGRRQLRCPRPSRCPSRHRNQECES